MNIKMMNKSSSRGHPCSGCPYVFTRGGTDCIMGVVPGDCAWYFYKRMMGHREAVPTSEEIRRQYRECVKRQSKAEEKLERGIAMLYEVAELKYGRKYAQYLQKKISQKGDTDETKGYTAYHK